MTYPGDPSFAEWHLLEPLLPVSRTVGYPHHWPRKRIGVAVPVGEIITSNTRGLRWL